MPPPFATVVETGESRDGSTFSSFRMPAAAGSAGIALVGELDLMTAERARAALRSAQFDARVLVCDLADVWFVDMTGLVVLLDAATRANLTGRRLTITNCPTIVPRMLTLLKLEDALEIEAAPRSAAAPMRPCERSRRHVSRRR